ncbi:ATP-binding cassette domain-containing protein [Sorangium sp. So ce315]|uniref:ATP-binding cassette domain-containing protein n=1 Tax=Sorangium sp. So ce315 TaxID=3133299 RepID=UPI003F613EE4
MRQHRFLAPEVIQTSSMDCGPAALKCLLDGFGIPVSYGRLREACQTDVDGTSIDMLEEIAVQLGLEAEQIMLPVDYLLLPEARATPSLLVVRLPNGAAHFVVLWSRHGRFVQVMDPATGRRWMRASELLADVYVHTTTVPESTYRAFAASELAARVLARRLERLGVAGAARRVAAAADAASFRPIAELDAAARMVDTICATGGLPRGGQSARVLESFLDRLHDSPLDGPPEAWAVPQMFWTAWPGPESPPGEPRLFLRGAVLVAVSGRRATAKPAGARRGEAGPRGAPPAPAPASPELALALRAPAARPARELLRLLREGGLAVPAALACALALTTLGIVVLTVLFKALLEIGAQLGLHEQRLVAIAGLLGFILTLIALEVPTALGVQWMGRHLEVRLRAAFLRKIPRLGDRYLRSRLASDMAERCHAGQRLRLLPDLLGRFIRFSMELVLTTAGIIWLDPQGAPAAIAACVSSVAVPLATQPPLTERDLRVRSHGGTLTRFYLDALLGLFAIRTHGAERSVRREHEGILVEWARASRSMARAVVSVEGVNTLVAYGLAALLLAGHVDRTGSTSAALLMLFWALNLPALGQEIALIARQLPGHRNVMLRLLEPLGAAEESPAGDERVEEDAGSGDAPTGVRLEGVRVVAGGHTILDDVNVAIEPGEHVAIVGPSGAGKSSLVGLLLGWHRPAAGAVLVDGLPLSGARLRRLRARTAWVDPEVQLWNRPLLDNLTYGTDELSGTGTVLDDADLVTLLRTLPDGLQTDLGEGGGLLSGGEGQRVRLGRAMLRKRSGLVLLDEPFRGLDRARRRALLARAREVWAGTTLLCITHDVGETTSFRRVLVVEEGRVVEDAPPEELAAREGSRYRALLDAEREVQETLWASAAWRRLRVEHGQVVEGKLRG